VNHLAIIATHHKTGTVWMNRIFRRIAKALGVRFAAVRASIGLSPESAIVPSILFNDHSNFVKCGWLLEDPRCRIFHVIRDPRDVILSAAHYHRTAGESWLHKRKSAFRGLSYQEQLNGLPDDQSRYLFEMRNSAGRVITDMRQWRYGMPNTIECKYEDLIIDIELELFDKVLRHLGLLSDDPETCYAIVRNNSLFGELGKKEVRHVHSGQARQWQRLFNSELAVEFLALFGDVLIRLGYESDDSWVTRLPPWSEQDRAVEDIRIGQINTANSSFE